MYRRFALAVASFFGVGYIPVAPGTFGTLAALPAVWGASLLSLWGQAGVAVGVTAVAIVASAEAGRHFGVADASQIVIDEVAGFLVTMIAVPFTAPNVVAGFLLFRLFDIFKPWPASFFDRKIKNGAGVVLDDVVAGLYARAGMAGLLVAFPGVFHGT